MNNLSDVLWRLPQKRIDHTGNLIEQLKELALIAERLGMDKAAHCINSVIDSQNFVFPLNQQNQQNKL